MRRFVGMGLVLGALAASAMGFAGEGGELGMAMRGGGKLPVVGYAWDGAPVALSGQHTARGIAAQPKGDTSVSLMVKGGKNACRRMEQVKQEGKALPKLKLRNRAKTVGVVLRKAKVLSVDCSANPWSVELDADQVKVREKDAQ